MFPEDPNPNQNQNPGQPDPNAFQRRPVQPIAPRPFAPAAPQQPQNFNPQPIQPQAPQSTQQPFSPQNQPQLTPAPPQPAPQFRPASQPIPQPTTPPAPPSGLSQQAQAGQAPAFRPTQTPEQPALTGFTRPARPQTDAEKPGLPKGVFAVIILGIAALAVGVIDKSQYNLIFNVIIGLNLLLAFGLLFVRKEVVRKAAAGFALATVTASAALVLGYWGLSNSTVNAEAAFIAEAKKLQNQSPTKQLTHEQQQHLDGMQLQLEAQQRAVGKDSALVYSKYGATVVTYGLIALYLTRPRVKQAFQPAKQ